MSLSSPYESYSQRVLDSTVQMVLAIVCGAVLIWLAMFFTERQAENHEREPTNANAMDVKRKIAQEDDSIAIIGLDRLMHM